jgi:hypothetical protein
MTKARNKSRAFFSCAEAAVDYLLRHLSANSLLYGSGCQAAGRTLDEIVAALRKRQLASNASPSGYYLPDTASALRSLRGGARLSGDGIAHIIVSSFFSIFAKIASQLSL